jgi:manganese transport protein
LVWVLVSACLIAMFIQYLSAKTGLATGRDLPTLCRESFLFGVPLFPTALITAVPGFAILALRRRGYRPFELAIAFLLGPSPSGSSTPSSPSADRPSPASPPGW